MITLATDLSLLTQLNLIFYIILAFAVLVGILRGFKKSLFSFVTMAIFYLIFFLTLNAAVNMLWGMNLPFLGSVLGQIDPSLSNFTSFKDNIGDILQVALGSNVDISMISDDVLLLGTGIGQFALKLVWTILYFTVILIIYKLICLIIRLIFFKSKKGENKNRVLGGVFGALNGLMAIFILMIVMGGFMDVVGNMATIVDDFSGSDTQTLTYRDRSVLYEASYNLSEAQTLVVPMESDSFPVEDLQSMVDAYNNNIFVRLGNAIQTQSVIDPDDPDAKVPLTLNLFDRVLSFDYNNKTIAIRYELSVFGEATTKIMNSDFLETNDISDLSGTEITDMFKVLEKSNLIVAVMPLAIEIAADEFDHPLTPEMKDKLFNDTDFAEELDNLGVVAGTFFDTLKYAQVIETGPDATPVTVTPADVRLAFSKMADSNVVTLMVENVFLPMLMDGESDVSTIITIPDNFDVSKELLALGDIFAEIVDSGLTLSDLGDADANVLLDAASKIDLTVLMESDLVTEALINVLSGNSDIQGLDALTVPDDVVWRDSYDVNDNLVPGELRKMLVALNALTEFASDVDINNLSIGDIVKMQDTTLNDLFGSRVIRATVTEMLDTLDLTGSSQTVLVFPTSVFDSDGYLTKDALVDVVTAIKLIVTDSGGDVSFDVMKTLNLTGSEIDTLLDSQIISATIGNLLYGMGSDSLTIPTEVVVPVTTKTETISIVNSDEVKNILLALSVLDISGFDNVNFDAGIFDNLEKTDQTALDDAKITTLLNSEIIRATVSKMILDLDSSNGGALDIPVQDQNGNAVIDTTGSVDLLTKAEINAVLQALYKIGIDNFSNIDLNDTSVLINNSDVLLQSAIIQATISKTLLDVDPTILIVPETAEDNTPIKITTGPVGDQTTFVAKDEISALLDAFEAMGFTNINTFTAEFSPAKFLDNYATVLLSSSMQATLSDQILNLSSGVLIVPDKDQSDNDIRIVKTDVTYIRNSELNALMASLKTFYGDDTGTLTSFDDFDVVPGDIFGLTDPELDTFLNSNIMQASVSDKVFIGSSDEITPVSGTLIIPTYYNEAIKVEGVDAKQIEKTELKNLIHALNVMDITNFDGNVSASKISTLESADIDVLLTSGSMHTTIDYMLQQNANVNTSIPDIIVVDLPYKTGIITVAETKAFILATKELGNDVTNFNIDISDLTGLTTTQKETIMSSMIVRCKLTPQLELAAPGAGVTITGSDYEGSTPDALIYATALAIVS